MRVRTSKRGFLTNPIPRLTVEPGRGLCGYRLASAPAIQNEELQRGKHTTHSAPGTFRRYNLNHMLAPFSHRRRHRSGDWMHGKACLRSGQTEPDPPLSHLRQRQVRSASNRGMAGDTSDSGVTGCPASIAGRSAQNHFILLIAACVSSFSAGLTYLIVL